MSPRSSPSAQLPLRGNDFAEHLVARLLELTSDTAPWPRRQWDLGTVLALRELHEAGQWVSGQVLSDAALRWLCRTLERQVAADRGVGQKELRQQLQATLRANLPEHGQHRRRLEALINMINSGYLARWAEAVDSSPGVSPERLARATASHLLDQGYSPAYLHGLIRLMAGGPATVGDLLARAAELAEATPRRFEVLVPFSVIPRRQQLAEGLPEWRTGRQVRDWLKTNAPGQSVRHNGAFMYSVEALDPYAAGRTAAQLVERLVARSSYLPLNRSVLEPVGRLWVSGLDESLPLRVPARGAEVLYLERLRTLYQVADWNPLDDALQLAASLNSGTPGPAVAGGWAAVESLLYNSGDEADRKVGRAVAATRLAWLVTCSWPRAELTSLSYQHKPAEADSLSKRLSSAKTNRERAQAVADAIKLKPANVVLRSPSDVAARERMTALIDAPKPTLRGVLLVVESSLRRLYRQRNIVLHGGSTRSVALTAALRTAVPLVGAGLDRITYAYLSDGVSPLDLAERADLRLSLAGVTHGAASVVELLA